MFEFDIDKHEPKARFNRQGVDCYLCIVRKRLIGITPEERVRQALVNYLVNEIQFPVDRIEIEVPLCHFKEKEKGRADIIIYDPDDNPLILIECKKPGELFGESVKNQLIRYDEVIGAQHFMIVIGNHVRLFHHDENEKKTGTHLTMQPYHFFLQGGEFEYSIEEDNETLELPIGEPFDEELVEEMKEIGHLGEGTKRELYPIIFNLTSFFYGKAKVVTEEITDLGIRVTKFSNAGGGNFPGNYRAFLVKRRNENFVVSFLVTSVTNLVIENYKSATCLAVAIDFEDTSHLSLQLRIDNYFELNSGFVNVWHDGTLTVGKMGMAKRKEVMDFIEGNAPHLIRDKKIFLGAFSLNERILPDQENTIDFLRRTIDYALIRDEFRNMKKANQFKPK